MKKHTILLVLVLLASCAAPTASAPTASATLPAPTATDTLEPTSVPSPRPAETMAYYRIRVEYATTSDWSTLELLNPEDLLAVRTMEVLGEPLDLETGVRRMALNQSIADAQAGKRVGVSVDYALSPEGLDRPLEFQLQKGDIGKGEVNVYRVGSGSPVIIHAFEHSGVVPNSAGLNSKKFSVDLSPLKESPALTAQLQPAANEKLVWAFFYPWFTADNWSSDWLKDRPLERYDSGDKETIARQVEQAQSAGIDGFISSWWGPGSDTDRNLKRLLEIAAQKDFKVSIYFETLAGPNGDPLGETKIREWLAYAIREYRDHPAFMKVDDKPLIVVWASAAVPLDAWGRVFASLRDEGLDAVYLGMGYSPGNLDVFDGLHDYGIFTYSNLEQTYQTTARAVRHYGLLAEGPVRKMWVATVQPGYDDTLQPSREGLVQERLNGDYYRSTWEASIQSNPDWIFITTWNEWWEHTHIEPGELYGDLYLQITKEFADKWKGVP